MKTRNKSYRLVRRAGQQGTRPSGGNQPEVEKYASGTSSSEDDLPGNQNQDIPNPEPVVIPPKQPKAKRTRWTKEEYKTVLRAFYTAQKHPTTNLTAQSFTEWRKIVGNEVRENFNPNKLANVQRDIIKNKRLTDAEIDQIRASILNVEIVDNAVEPEPAMLNQEPDDNEINDSDVVENRNPADVVEDANLDEFIEQHRDDIEEARLDILREFSRTEHQEYSERDSLPKITQSSKLRQTIKIYNVALKDVLDNQELDLSTLNIYIYAAGKAISNTMGNKLKKKTKKHVNKAPKWKIRLQKEIDALRAELSILDEISKGTLVKTKKARNVKKRNEVTDEKSLLPAKETIKQKIQVKAQRLRRFDKRTRFYRQNKIFQTDAKKFYREIGKGTINVEEPPVEEDMTNFWNGIWGKEKEFNSEAEWIKREQERMNEVEQQQWDEITVIKLRNASAKSQKWKSPGVDKMPNFWLNSLTSSHEKLAINFTKILQNPESAPEWLTEGTTYLLPKNQETQNPKNYRPITCLTTTYKILTSIITNRMYNFLDDNAILPQEQKGCKRNSYGCKDQLLINRTILENCRKSNRNLSTAWIDYKKAFDSVPHDWILKAIEIYKFSPIITNFLKSSMDK
ncbi:uncharacterized protein LOC134765758 [Penaeus indicus]|uniref:uncharacterized protein LOC134765758 n=1 Tax=Penaeus indicus TaxID=29960 RepID=UPI00300D1A01